MRKLFGLGTLGVIGTLASACVVTPPPQAVRYVDTVFTAADKSAPRVYGTAPDLQTGAPTNLVGVVYTPQGDTATNRPAIVWVHGGGFKGGSYPTIDPEATAYTQRGYVGFNINYRLDPTNRCQEIQDGTVTDPDEITKCSNAIRAAKHDTFAAVRWIRANAATLGVDPGKIAVGGFSAGAVTATNAAYNSDDAGTSGNPGYPSNVQATFGASGCNYDISTIGAGDAPLSMIASTGDRAVPYTCSKATVDTATAAGLVAELTTYPNESTHALTLYRKYQAATDAQWTRFLVTNLGL